MGSNLASPGMVQSEKEIQFVAETRQLLLNQSANFRFKVRWIQQKTAGGWLASWLAVKIPKAGGSVFFFSTENWVKPAGQPASQPVSQSAVEWLADWLFKSFSSLSLCSSPFVLSLLPTLPTTTRLELARSADRRILSQFRSFKIRSTTFFN